MGAKARLFFRRFLGVSHVTGTLPDGRSLPLTHPPPPQVMELSEVKVGPENYFLLQKLFQL